MTFHHFSAIEVLKERSATVDLVGPVLPALKTIIERAFAQHAEIDDPQNILSNVLHGLLSQSLDTVEGVM